MSVKVGDIVPNVSLYEDTPANKVQTDDLLANKKVVIFGVPGAFTPVSHEFFSLALYRYSNYLSTRCHQCNTLTSAT